MDYVFLPRLGSKQASIWLISMILSDYTAELPPRVGICLAGIWLAELAMGKLCTEGSKFRNIVVIGKVMNDLGWAGLGKDWHRNFLTVDHTWTTAALSCSTSW